MSLLASTAQGQISDVLKIGNGAEPHSLDPAKALSHVESAIIDNLFAGIVELDPISLTPIPGLAESWTLSSDRKTYRFQLRPNLKWSDGKPLTAENVVWSWIRSLRPETAAPYAYKFYPIAGAEAFNQGKVKNEKYDGVTCFFPLISRESVFASSMFSLLFSDQQKR